MCDCDHMGCARFHSTPHPHHLNHRLVSSWNIACLSHWCMRRNPIYRDGRPLSDQDKKSICLAYYCYHKGWLTDHWEEWKAQVYGFRSGLERYPSVVADVFWDTHPSFEWPTEPKPGILGNEPAAPVLKAREHNLQNALLYNLPNEILFLIQEYVEDGYITMALRGTCSRFMHLFDDPTLDKNNIFEIEMWRRDYTAKRRDWKLQDLCRLESIGGMKPGELVCSLCYSTHEKSMFRQEDVSKAPEERACVGWTRKLKICSHKSITFQSIRHYKPGLWCGRKHSSTMSYLGSYLSHATIWQSAHSSFKIPWYEWVGGGRGMRLELVGEGVDDEGRPAEWLGDNCHFGEEHEKPLEKRKLVLRCEVVLKKLGQDERLDAKELLDAVAEMGPDHADMGMCPHLNHDSVMRLLDSEPYVDCPNFQNHLMNTVPCPPTTGTNWPFPLSLVFPTPTFQERHACAQRYHCIFPDCGTEFYFYRSRYLSFGSGWKDELVLCVVRTLGECFDALDQRWLSQLIEDDGND